MRGSVTHIGVNQPYITIEHKGQTLDFSASVFGRRSLTGEDLFQYMNQYWAGLPEEDQDKIFSIYLSASIMFDGGNNWIELTKGLKSCINDLLVYHQIDKLRLWIGFKTDIGIPSSIVGEFVDDIDSKNSRVKTYIKREYADLLALALLLRCLLPIWGEYVFTTRNEFGNEFKEFYAFLLINDTELYRHEVFRRLSEYITAVIATDKADDRSIESGISTEDYITKQLALVSVRKLCVAPLKPIDPNAHLCTSIHNYITPNKGMSTGHPEDIIREKSNTGGGQDETNKLSNYETFRAAHELSAGDRTEFNEFFRDVYGNVLSMFPGIDKTHLIECLNRSEQIRTEGVREPQIKLAKAVFSEIIPIEAFDYLDPEIQAQGIAATEAVLFHKGHQYLGVLSTSTLIMSEGMMTINNMDKKDRIPDSLTDELIGIYPSKIVTNTRKGRQEEYYVFQAIDAFMEDILRFSWKPTVSQAVLDEMFGGHIRKFPIRSNIRALLMQFYIDVGSGKFHNLV